jgi:hypothetical protein
MGHRGFSFAPNNGDGSYRLPSKMGSNRLLGNGSDFKLDEVRAGGRCAGQFYNIRRRQSFSGNADEILRISYSACPGNPNCIPDRTFLDDKKTGYSTAVVGNGDSMKGTDVVA